MFDRASSWYASLHDRRIRPNPPDSPGPPDHPTCPTCPTCLICPTYLPYPTYLAAFTTPIFAIVSPFFNDGTARMNMMMPSSGAVTSWSGRLR